MAKKFVATYYDKQGNPFDASGPYHGEWTSRIADQVMAQAARNKAAFITVTRVTKEGYKTYLGFDLVRGEMVPGKNWML